MSVGAKPDRPLPAYLLDLGTIITSFPERWHQGAEKTLLNSINDEDTITFSSPEELVEHIAYRCVTFTEEPFKSGLDEHFLDIFANEIAKIVGLPYIPSILPSGMPAIQNIHD
jgi:hypothetical protein